MRILRWLLLGLLGILTITIGGILGPIGYLIGIPAILGFLFLTRGKSSVNQGQFASIASIGPPNRKSMSFKRFLGLLWIVVLLSVLYAPAIKFPIGSIPTIPSSFTSMAPFVTHIQSRYHVLIANNTEMLLKDLNQTGNKAYFLIGPDHDHTLTKPETTMIEKQYRNGTLSLLIAEGNSTNNPFLHSLLHATVKGDVILDRQKHPSYSLTQNGDPRVFNVTGVLGSQKLNGVIDVASPIILENSTRLWTVASSSMNSTDESPYYYSGVSNKTQAPRIVIAAGESNESRTILISDSAPFSTIYNNRNLQEKLGINETAFALALTDWVVHSDPKTTIILDNAHYNPVPSLDARIFISFPIGQIFALILATFLQFSNATYNAFLAISRPFLLGLALFTTWGLYGSLTKRYATEKRGKDDQPLPIIEKMIVAESRERTDYLATSRNKGFYVASLQQMYEVLDSLLVTEFGTEISKLTSEQLNTRFGPEQALEVSELFRRLTRIAQYASGQKRFLFPPIFRWKRTTKNLTEQTEKMLNQLGLTMTGKAEKKQLAYKLRRG
jgi:hypothetical protein